MESDKIDESITNDDELTEIELRRARIYEELCKIKSPPQRSQEWFNLRNKHITASDAGCVIGVDEHNPQYTFLFKKTGKNPFVPNNNCYHGKKYENIAKMLYEKQNNVKVSEFGLLFNKTLETIAASPDGIVSKYKNDNKSLTKLVGRMLEIKCPVNRNMIKNKYPQHYLEQVYVQLETCELDECDFFQCVITEYTCIENWFNDIDITNCKSKTNNLETGCVIQYIPIDKYTEDINELYNEIVYEESTFRYPPRLDMSVMDLTNWINKTKDEIVYNEKNNKCCFDCVKYWRVNMTDCLLVKKDPLWIVNKYPIYQKMWNYVLYLRENEEVKETLYKYMQCLEKYKILGSSYNYKKKINDIIFLKLDKIINNINELIILKDEIKQIIDKHGI